MESEKLKRYCRNRKITDAVFVLFFVCTVALLLWKAPYGFHFFDETYYYSTAHRLMQGDIFLVDDWDICQFSLVLLYPIVKLSCLLHGGTEGLILTARYAFVFFHAVNTLILYLLLRKNAAEKGLGAAAVYCLYSHLFIEALSYYQMSLDFCLLCALLLVGEREGCLVPAGLFFALAVLTCPYLVFVYVLYALLCLLRGVSGKAKRGSAVSGKGFALFTLGCALPAAVFLIFVLRRATVTELITAVPHFLGEPSHNPVKAGGKLLRLIPDLMALFSACDIPLLLCFAAVLFDQRRAARKGLYAFCLAAAGILSLTFFYLGSFVGNVLTLRSALMLPMTLAGAAAYLLCTKRDRELFRFVYLGGFVLLICMYLASDTGISVLNTTLCISAVASCCFIVQLASELRSEGKMGMTAALLCLAFLSSQLFVEFMLRKNYCFSEPAGVSMMYETIDHGIGKGERTTEIVKVYEQDGLWEATEKVRNAKGDYVVYFSDDCWPYLEDEKKCGSFTTWILARNAESGAERLLDYWELHPEKKPDAIYVSKGMKNAETVVKMINTEDFPVEENERGYVMIRDKN